MSFKSQISAFTQKVEDNSEKVFRGTALQLFGEIVRATPVGNKDLWENRYLWGQLGFVQEGYTGGRLRGNWQAEVNGKNIGQLDTVDKNGSNTVAKGQANMASAKAGDSIYLFNNLPYAIPVEYGHSAKQRPEGMVRVTLLGFNKAIAENAAKVNK